MPWSLQKRQLAFYKQFSATAVGLQLTSTSSIKIVANCKTDDAEDQRQPWWQVHTLNYPEQTGDLC